MAPSHEAADKYFQEKLEEIPIDVLDKAVDLLKKGISKEQKRELCAIYSRDKHVFADVGHITWGKGVKLILRNAGLKDEMLPDGDWDDYYMQIVEIAIGVRQKPDRILKPSMLGKRESKSYGDLSEGDIIG